MITSYSAHFDSILRSLDDVAISEPIVSGKRIVPGFWIDLDPEVASFDGKVSVGDANLLDISYSASTVGRWCSLNFDLGAESLSEEALIGFACRVQAPRTMTARLLIRSFTEEGGHVDTQFPEYLVAFGEENTHSDVCWISDSPALKAPATGRVLIIMLDPAGFDLSIREPRVFTA